MPAGLFIARTLTNRLDNCQASCYIRPVNITTEQAAKAVGITRATLQDWIRKGKFKGPAVKLRKGRAVRLWSDSDVARLRAVKKEIYQEQNHRPKK